MSRHRNIRNLTEDDYYDEYDDDDYYDDYYDEEDDYYKAPPKPKPVVTKKVPTKKVTSSTITSSNSRKSTTTTAPVAGMTSSKKSTLKTGMKKNTTTTTATTTTASSSSNVQKWKREKEQRVLELQQQQKQQQEERTKQLSVVLFGHVDAGKSTLLGQLLVACGMVSQKLVQQYETEASLYHSKKTSFAYAWILDSSEEERERGVTMNVTSRQLTYNSIDYTLLDAPGHEELIPIMMTGCTSQADVGLLVINASTIKTVQTSLSSCEHLSLARALGIPKLIIVLNQCDTCHFDQSLLQQMIAIIQPHIRQNGYSTDSTPIVPISAYHNINLLPTTPIPSTLSSWYKGSTLLSTMEKVGLSLLEQRQDKVWKTLLIQPTRLLVSDMTTTTSTGNTASIDGRLLQGCCFPKEDVLQIMPSGQFLSCTSSSVDPIVPFQGISSLQVQLISDKKNNNSSNNNTETVDLDTLIRPGTILIDPSDNTTTKVLYSKFQVQLSFVVSETKKTLIVGSQMLFHMHSLQLPCTITKLEEKRRTISSDLQQSKPFTVELTLLDNQQIVASNYVDCKALGRFILRKHGSTIAFGIITQTIS